MSVLIETSLGDIVVDLFYEESPLACTNFLKLCKIKYYHSCLFHTIQRDFLASCGDPENTGKGGNSIWGVCKGESPVYFKSEFRNDLSHNRPGLLSTANLERDKNTSTFFITLAGGLERLDKRHTIFGEIAEGLDVLMKLNDAYCDEEKHPLQVIRIRHTDILYDPFPDPSGLLVPDSSPEPPRLLNGRLDDEVDFDPDAGKTEEEIAEEKRNREAEANAEVLKMLGDIKDKNEAPPENVLFICKLNPITEEGDLELIFSQFGKVVGCEIIKDYMTGDSLCFGFIEFADQSDCERAYLKMDNVLIDDRRVHVDFSQSTSRHKSGDFSASGSRYAHLMQKGGNGAQTGSSGHRREVGKRERNYDDHNDRKRQRRYSPERRDRYSRENNRNRYHNDHREERRRDSSSYRRDDRREGSRSGRRQDRYESRQ